MCKMEPEETITIDELIMRLSAGETGKSVLRMASGKDMYPMPKEGDGLEKLSPITLLRRTVKELADDGFGWICGTVLEQGQQTTSEIAAVRILSGSFIK